jgi:ribosome-associated protein
MDKVEIYTEYITVSAFLKLAGAVMSGGEAGDAISRGLVKVDGEICVQKRKKLFAGQVVVINGVDYKVVRKCI